MKILAVETATSWQSVAILDGDAVLAREERDAGSAHGMLLLPAIDRLLAQAGLRLIELDGLACSIGPGSFTGIRVGIATCLGLRAATGLPLALVPTLEAMASGVITTARSLCPTLPGRTGELYWALFRRTEEGQLQRVQVEHVGPPEHMARSMVEDTVVFGGGWSKMEAEIRAAVPAPVTLSPGPEHCAKPCAVKVGLLGMQRLRCGEVAGTQVQPLYVQQSEAEIKYEQSGGVSPAIRRQARVAVKAARRMEKEQRRTEATARSRGSYGS
jgi:tRNA threonylcarbamoyladenosine biosynthesis protein TsaB